MKRYFRYSTLADPVARLDQALFKNQRLLTDFDLVRDFIAANQSRLQHNVDLVEQNVFLDLVKKQVQYRPQLREIAELWSLKV
jgi:hypothetical protein